MRKTLWMTAVLLATLLLAVPSLSAQVGSSSVVSTKKVDAKKVVKPKKIFAPVDKRWENTIRLLYEFPISVGIHYDGMYRIHKAVGIGIGTGYDYVFCPWEDRKSSFQQVPVYAQFRFYLIGEKRVNPFFGIAQGIDIGFYKILNNGVFTTFDSNPRNIVSECMFVGSRTRLEIGLNVRITATKSILFSVEGGASACPDTHYDNNRWKGDHKYYPALGFNLGFTF